MSGTNGGARPEASQPGVGGHCRLREWGGGLRQVGVWHRARAQPKPSLCLILLCSFCTFLGWAWHWEQSWLMSLHRAGWGTVGDRSAAGLGH